MRTRFADLERAISIRLKDARKKAGYKSAREFSTKNGLPQTTYWQHENFKRSIGALHALKYAQLLDISLDWLLAGGETLDEEPAE